MFAAEGDTRGRLGLGLARKLGRRVLTEYRSAKGRVGINRHILTRKCFIQLCSMGLENLKVDDDGLVCADVHHWAEEKYRLLALYDQLFSSGMKNKWDQRVYIDLYAGAGFSHIQGTSTFFERLADDRPDCRLPIR